MSASNLNFTSKAENTLSEAHSLASSYSHIESKNPSLPLPGAYCVHANSC